jgi:hypothetical protein
MSSSSSKKLYGSIVKTIVKSSSSSKKLPMSNKTELALKWLIANIVFIVKHDGGLIIDHSESKVLAGSYTFYIQNLDIEPPSSNIISSVDIALTWDKTILETPRTRSLKRKTADIFYIQLVKTDPNHRNKGWATLLLIYTIAYLQIKHPATKIFTLSDESANSSHIKNNIYDRLGFIYMYNEAMDISQHDRTIPTTQKKILDFNIEPIYRWATVRCLKLIFDILKNEPMLLALLTPFNPDELIGGKSKKQRNITRKQANRTRKHSRKQAKRTRKHSSKY